jgi:hypothetical protein
VREAAHLVPPIRTERTPENEAAFLAALSDGYSIFRAAKAASIGRTTAYEWRDADEDFKNRWLEAVENGTDTLEDEARDRAMDDSDTLLIFTLKARRPEKYRDNVNHNHSGNLNILLANYVPTIEGESEEIKVIGEGDG